MTHTARQQVVRLDSEPATAIGRNARLRIMASVRQRLPRSQALLISDYGYGSATPEMFERVRTAANGIPVTLDSRFRMLSYRGVTAATPNEPEVEEALACTIGTNHSEVLTAGRRLMRRMKLDSLIITRGRDGMVVFSRNARPIAIPISGSSQVADVTGAGDTVIAVFTAALAAGADAHSAALLANYAGGIVVMKRGTATVSRDELLAAISKEPGRSL
jgi:rfaE bifunctional protein kinase chain/domain